MKLINKLGPHSRLSPEGCASSKRWALFSNKIPSPVKAREDDVMKQEERKAESDTLGEVCHRMLGANCPQFLARAIGRAMGVPGVEALYIEACGKIETGSRATVFDHLLEALEVNLRIPDEELNRIPAEGPLLVVGNHPFGGLDGLLLGALLSKRRRDFRLLANALLTCFPAFRPWLFEVEVLREKGSTKHNASSVRRAARWLKEGGCLVTFPAGAVSHLHWRTRMAEDAEWSPHIASLARMSGAHVLPVRFEGSNSRMFRVLGLLSPRLRTFSLGRELLNKRGCRPEVRIGETISADKMRSFPDSGAAIGFLRATVDAMRVPKKRESSREEGEAEALGYKFEPVVAGPSRVELAEEVRGLHEEALLVCKGKFSVYGIRVEQAPKVMREIGRLRELTFRSVGEGTGTALDLDAFDRHYHQIFVWDEQSKAVAGGYRVGVVDEVIPSLGRRGMYATSQFSLSRSFYKALGPAAELGRSFIPLAYQRKFSLLGLLWRGIGEFLNRRPEVRILYGPVSISADYSQVSKRLMVRYLRRNQWSSRFARGARPRHRYRGPRLSPGLRNWLKEEGRTLDEVSAVISHVEPDGKGVPVLVKHYLKLNGGFVGFGVDPNFCNALDGLIVVDLHDLDDAHLKRYFGQAGFERVRKAELRLPASLSTNA